MKDKVKKYTVLLTSTLVLPESEHRTSPFWVYAADPDGAVMHARHKLGKAVGADSSMWYRFSVEAVYEGHLWDENPEAYW